MHDLLRDARTTLLMQPIFQPGRGQFHHIKYCRFCSYSEAWITEHGHGGNCLMARLDKAVISEIAPAEQK